ncbi:MAG: ABC transporter ATP-binding protein [Burkholderiaceae bacterium]|nr:MAG: ABC transporter ATP-binding protein [Burkholderiaceae bacterium]
MANTEYPLADVDGGFQLCVENLTKEFLVHDTAVRALDNVSFSVKRGEFLVIVGPSGCGKSTLLRIVQGLDSATSGKVTLNRKGNKAGSDCGFVFQQDSLYPWRTVLKNVMLGLEISRRIDTETEARARALLETVGLKGFENHYPGELSGGMRQRVNLARGLSIDPQMLLMDEPFAALDAITRETMQQELLRIVLATNKTVIFITHQIDEAVLLADRVLVMSARPGRIVDTVPIDFPRPRSLELKRSPSFQKFVGHIWEKISETA